MLNFYQILGVSQTASESEIKKAYRQLAKVHHPDLNPNNDFAATKFRQITEAYQTLSNPQQRSIYDDRLNYKPVYTQSTYTNANPHSSPTPSHPSNSEEGYTYIEVPNKAHQKMATVGAGLLFLALALLPIVGLVFDIKNTKSEKAYFQNLKNIELEKRQEAKQGLHNFASTQELTYYISKTYDNHFQLNKQFKERFHLPLYQALLTDTNKLVNVQCFTPDSTRKSISFCMDIHQKLAKQEIDPQRIRTFVSNDSIGFKMNQQFYPIIVTILEE